MAYEPQLTPTSYIVLGLIRALGEATPYDLKSAMAAGVKDLWSLQHAQLYAEPARLAAGGYLNERQEEDGRRRKHYTITDKGREALGRWLREPPSTLAELRDPALLKILFGADPKAMADTQRRLHEERLTEYEALLEQSRQSLPEGARFALEAGVGHQREWVRFWAGLAGD